MFLVVLSISIRSEFTNLKTYLTPSHCNVYYLTYQQLKIVIFLINFFLVELMWSYQTYAVAKILLWHHTIHKKFKSRKYINQNT